MKMITTKTRVATEPFPDMAVRTVREGTGTLGVARIQNADGVVALRILANSEDYRFMAGWRVLVRSSNYTAGWAKAVQHVEGLPPFILVPDVSVEAILVDE